ncbi:MAG: hypothetical protein A3J06_03610 [Candidatus Moranbacteria bacterium RIFCSPLOWO2_02_FULL_48_19]|nr:MAG: hypothetical protein A3J06_03610 [Candidatus Moranbacteria bacterium RIFCSPLOWO2_02_FULL_48_19]
MKPLPIIEKVKNEILDKTKPVSIFLYGSYNTSEYLPGTSDLEIGVLRKNKGDVTSVVLRHIAEKHSTVKIRLRIYAYDLDGFKRKTINSPFTKSVFIRHLILTAKTIWGEAIIENLPLPKITLLDAYREACFTTMRALSALFFLRAGNMEEAQEMTYKACLFATLSLEYLNSDFPIGFANIIKASKKLRLTPGERKMLEQAHKLRKGKLRLPKEKMYNLVFSVITYCNQTVEARVREQPEKGDRVLIK